MPAYTASNKQELDALFNTQPFASRVGILVDFGIIVSQKVINYFPRGIINSHFSLLPEWRGADPITFSILSGQRKTGVSLMLLSSGMDEGLLLAQTPYDIPPDATTPSLTSALIELSDHALKIIVPLWLEDKVTAMPQGIATMAASIKPSYSRKLTKEDGLLDWTKPAAVLEREIRAFTAWPKSRTRFGSLEIVITKASATNGKGIPGTPTIISKKPAVFCGEGALCIERLKPAGKQEMTGEAFLAGYKNIFLA